MKMSKSGDVREWTSVTYHKRGSWAELPAAGGRWDLEAKPPAAGQFFGKQSLLNAIGSHSVGVQNHLKAN